MEIDEDVVLVKSKYRSSIKRLLKGEILSWALLFAEY